MPRSTQLHRAEWWLQWSLSLTKKKNHFWLMNVSPLEPEMWGFSHLSLLAGWAAGWMSWSLRWLLWRSNNYDELNKRPPCGSSWRSTSGALFQRSPLQWQPVFIEHLLCTTWGSVILQHSHWILISGDSHLTQLSLMSKPVLLTKDTEKSPWGKPW